MYCVLILQTNQALDSSTLLLIIFLITSSLCGPIARALQERSQRRLNALAQQTQASQEPIQEKNLQVWEETLLTTKDYHQKIEVIARLGKFGTKDTLEMLSEYAENDRDPETLAAIENALTLLEQRLIIQKVKGNIEETPEP